MQKELQIYLSFAKDDHGPVIHRMGEARPCQDQAIEQRDGDADFRTCLHGLQHVAIRGLSRQLLQQRALFDVSICKRAMRS